MELCWEWNCWDAWDPSLCILLMHLGCTLPALSMNVVSTKWKHIMIIARRIPRMSHHCDPHHPSFKPHAIPLGVRAHTFWISLFPTKFPNSLFGAKFWIQMQPNCSIVALCVLNDRNMYALTVAFILGCRIVNVAD